MAISWRRQTNSFPQWFGLTNQEGIEMEMTLNSKLIIKLRTSRAWTQQHLSEVANLSLRTIQRVEKNGKGSPETIQAIAAAFETSTQTLLFSPTCSDDNKSLRKTGWMAGGIISTVGAAFLIMATFSSVSQASNIELKAKEMQSDKKLTKDIFKGDVEILIPTGMEVEFDGGDVWQSGDISVFTEEVKISVNHLLIVVKKGTLLYSESGLLLNTEYAEVSQI